MGGERLISVTSLRFGSAGVFFFAIAQCRDAALLSNCVQLSKRLTTEGTAADKKIARIGGLKSKP